MKYTKLPQLNQLGLGLILIIGLIIFVFSLKFASPKLNHTSLQHRARSQLSAPSGIDSSKTKIRFVDSQTNNILADRSVAIIVIPVCKSNGSCSNGQTVTVSTDKSGLAIIDKALLKQNPKLYTLGYRLDYYLSYEKVGDEERLTIYYPPKGAKSQYSLNLDPEIPIGLVTVNSD